MDKVSNGNDMGSSGVKFLVILAFVLISSATAGRIAAKIPGSKHIVKTIKADTGDIVYCIDMYKQPAFDHPLLENHTIQIHPSMGTNTLGSRNDVLWSKQSWHKKGSGCPHGSIPIKRQHNTTHDHHFRKRIAPQASGLGPQYHQHAVIHARTSAGTIHGIHATLNIWSPTVGPNDFSLTQLWLMAGGSGTNLNTMEVGWHVFPYINGDSQPRLFIYWTRDGYQTGCYDLVNCPGFVQTNSETVIGGALQFSTYGGDQYELDVGIQKDTQSGNWWLYVSGKPIGYWPSTLFTTLADAADDLEWGGEVYDATGGGGFHTSNQMGSGHFPNEGYKKSSYIRGIYYIDTSGSGVRPQDFDHIATIPSCYNLTMENGEELYLYYGGPGCQ